MTLQPSLLKPKKPKLFLVRRVLGDSMVPTLVPGTVVVGIRARTIKPGDVVVLRHGGLDKIKRVRDIQFDKIFVTGDNPMQSTDSRDLGWLSVESVLAKIIFPRKVRLSV